MSADPLCDDLNFRLLESQRRLQTILNQSPVGIGITRLRDGVIEDCNESFLDLLGYSRADVIGRTSLELNAWVDPDERAQVFARLAQGEAIREMASRIRRRDGEIRHIRFSAATTQMSGENYMVGTMRDVTAEYRAERQRLAAEKRLELALAILPAMVFHQDRDLRYTFVFNPKVPRASSEFIGRRAEDVFEAEDAALLTTIRRRVLATGVGERHEIPIHFKARTSWYDILVEPETDERGTIVGLVGAGVDITERKLREERYRRVVEDQTELIGRYRPNGVMTYANEVYCRFFGRMEAEIVGHTWHHAAHPDDIPMIEAALASLSATDPVVTIENRVYAADGSERWMQFVNRAFFDDRGQISELQEVGRDITDRKRAELELSESRARLHALFAATDDYRESQRKEIAREIHDQLGTLMTAIGFRIDRLKRQTEMLPAVAEEIGGIRSLVGQANEAARNICNTLRPPILDDLGLIPACRWYLKDWSTLTGIESSGRFARPGDKLPEQVSIELFRVFQELLNNVAKHSGAKHVRVSLALDTKSLRLRVTDDGHGFDSTQPTRGFGLMGVRERLARFAGLVVVTSGAKGTTVTTTLPPSCLR